MSSSVASASWKSLAAVVDAVASRAPHRRALVSPVHGNSASLTYRDLQRQSQSLAAWLQRYGYEPKDVLMSDLPNVSENLILQLACNRLGVGFATTKSLEGMATFPKIKGAVAANGKGFLFETQLPLPPLSGEFLCELIQDGTTETTGKTGDGLGLDDFLKDENDDDDDNDEIDFLSNGTLETPHGFYNTTTAYTNQQALEHGQQAATALSMTPDDVVCVAITLCHPFGIGSAVSSALQTGATIVLPEVGGITGCGVPSERASATLEALVAQHCTLMFCDTHTLKALPADGDAPEMPHLRGGACKIGSGSTFLDGETRTFAGVTLRTVGKPASSG